MRFAYYLRQPGAKPHEDVALAIQTGCVQAGDEFYIFEKDDMLGGPYVALDVDALILWGIGGDAKLVRDAYVKAGKHVILLDKPYTRGGKPGPMRYHWLRVSIDALHPTVYFRQFKRPDDRWKALGFDIRVKDIAYAMRSHVKPNRILFDGASNKYCLWEELGAWPTWGQQMVDLIAKHTDIPIIYRPRPSHNPPPAIRGADLSEGPIDEDFARARVVVSHGGNIGFDCIVRGTPHFAIGSSAARSLSETSFDRIGTPRIVSPEERAQWLYDIAYCQWNLDEFRSGTAWRYIRETLDLVKHLDLKLRVAHG